MGMIVFPLSLRIFIFKYVIYHYYFNVTKTALDVKIVNFMHNCKRLVNQFLNTGTMLHFIWHQIGNFTAVLYIKQLLYMYQIMNDNIVMNVKCLFKRLL